MEHVLQIYISPVGLEDQGKVILENSIQGQLSTTRNMKVYRTLEEAMEAVTFDPAVPQLTYEWLLADLSQQKAS